MSGAPPTAGWSALSREARDTAALGEALGRTAPDGALILLEGPLGAGKTTFAQGVGAGCGVREPITSPTYNLVLHYDGERPFTHVDLYRLDDSSELETLDLDALLETGGVTCVEWPELLRDRREPPWAVVHIAPDPAMPGWRRIRGELAGAGWEAAIEALDELAERAS